MTTFRLGDVVIIDYTFTNQAGSKPRPAVVVSRDEYNLVMLDAVLMPITSQRRDRTSFPDAWLEGGKTAAFENPLRSSPHL